MKKMLLSAAAFAVVAVSAVAVAPTTSEAIPAFARQTGAACLACHHLSFPALNAFGAAFKAGALTDVGEQALVEDDHLSITSSVNMTLVLRPNFTSVSTAAGTTKTAAITADQVVIVGGRVGTNTGTFVEIAFGGPTATGGFGNFKLTHSVDMAGGKAGVSIFNSGFGETYAYEVGSTFGQHGGMLSGKGLSANNNLSIGTGGAGFFYGNELVHANLSLVTTSSALGVTNSWKLAPVARLFLTPEVAGMRAGIGFGINSGKTGNANTLNALVGAPVGTNADMKKWFIDGQLQGEIGDIGIGFYADYAHAAASTATNVNVYNTSTSAMKGYSARIEVKPTHNIIVGGGIGQLKNAASKTAQWQVAAEYEIYQNFVVALIYNNSKTTPTGGVGATTKTTVLDIEALL
ncbi:hypothetical protein Ga0123462_2185 [Mariprofundus ferrinatatus]|uniref:Cytochrome c domain-containing protein n=1 Tax=Mariprofundus ferrinatatus TaxID=1921087 RepID=A0A2K8L9T9_9PROT|nr:hypothetical protein [Mariprofundus ferrinatatus]ATX83019.1 hypothetical protein Ga0123462_2185 [Mariprofundus ferrinatatus]